MVRCKMVSLSLGTLVLFSAGWGQTSNLRTADGQLRANTLLGVSAIVESQTGAPLSLSDPVMVRVGQYARIQVQPLGLTVFSLSDQSNFQFNARNLGNGEDQFRFLLLNRMPSESPWEIALYEDRNGNGIAEAPELLSTMTSSTAEPHETLPFLLKLTPPSDQKTDGALIHINSRSAYDARQQVVLNLAVGMEGTARQHSAVSPGDYALLTNPVFYNGRLYCLGTDANDSTRLYYTTTRMDDPTATLTNNFTVGGRVFTFHPGGSGVVLGSRWFMPREDGVLTAFDMSLLESGGSPGDALRTVQLPPGVLVKTSLRMAVNSDLLYLVGSDDRVYWVDRMGSVRGFSVRVPGNIASPPCVTNYWTAVGCRSGAVALLDTQTGVGHWTRRVSTLPIQHPIVSDSTGLLLFVVVDERYLVALETSRGSVVWRIAADSPIVSPPVYDPVQNALYFITANRTLYGVNVQTRRLLRFYPQTLFGENGTLTMASIALMRRSDRGVPYLYITAQKSTQNGSQGVFAMVTATNPLNRFYSNSIEEGAEMLPQILFTGSGAGYLAIALQKQSTSGGGRLYGFSLR